MCNHERRKKSGLTKAGTQRFKCLDCGKRFTESTAALAGMRIGVETAERVINMLVEGTSVSAAARIVGLDLHTVLDLLVTIGARCRAFMDRKHVALPVNEIQVDEIWQFIGCKQKTANAKGLDYGVGDSYTFTAIERNTKLLVTWHMGSRTQADTNVFCSKLAKATAGKFLVSTDGFGPYQSAIPQFLPQTDFGVVIKIFGKASQTDQRTYSPPGIVGMEKEAIMGSPDNDQISTSHAERMNGSIRCFTKRMGRLTYCFSKKWGNHEAALALFFCHYNYCREHATLKGRTPAMAAGLADKVWTIGEMLAATAA